jgi:putative hemolysin
LDDYCFIPLQVLHQASLWTSSGPLILVLVLLLISALISSSEVAMFSLSPSDLNDLRSSKSAPDQAIMELLEKPDKQQAPTKLLATILIANNAVNIAIVLLASELSGQWFPDGSYTEWVKTLIDVVAITFVIVLFGEVIPKVYATSNPVKVARIMAFPLKYIQKLCSPLTSGLMFLSSNLESLIKTSGKGNISVDELGHALELTVDDHLSDEENKILEGIVTFGTKEARQIMTPRTDIAFLWIEDGFEDVMKTVMDKGYSRLPVYRSSPDEIEGFLFIKDLLPYIDHTSFDWQKLIKKPFFVPENKMIDDLLQEFQHAKIHLAIVVDEYGGTSGLVTLEDILEEIVGDISDEFDVEELQFSRLDDYTYLFEGKTALVDMYKVLDLEEQLFEDARGDSSTLAGFFIEQAGYIPTKGDRITFESYQLEIEAADKRKIKRIKITLPKPTTAHS